MLLKLKRKRKKKSGGEGHRSPYLSHAKRALYHLSYTPYTLILKNAYFTTRYSLIETNNNRIWRMTGLRIAFLHPDLGIGGAERLVVDAAVALKQKGHDITMYQFVSFLTQGLLRIME